MFLFLFLLFFGCLLSHVFFCFLILSQASEYMFVVLFNVFLCFLYVPLICGIGWDFPEPWARGEWWATYPAAGSTRQPASRWQMRVFSAPRRTAHSVHIHSRSPSNLELPRQTQGAMHCTPNSPKCYAQGAPPVFLNSPPNSLHCAALRFHLVYWLGLP